MQVTELHRRLLGPGQLLRHPFPRAPGGCRGDGRSPVAAVVRSVRPYLMDPLGKAVDTVRKQENRALMAEGEKSFAGSECRFLYSQKNLPNRHRGRFASLRDSEPKTARVWAINETIRHVWEYGRRGWAERR